MACTASRCAGHKAMRSYRPLLAALLLVALPFGAQTRDEAGGAGLLLGLPEGKGREEVIYSCSSCHSIQTVAQQKLDREAWDETLIWMVEEQGMPELEPARRRLILNYLSTHIAPTS